MSSIVFGGEKVRCLTQRRPYLLSSMMVVVLCHEAVFLPLDLMKSKVNGIIKREDYLQILQENRKKSVKRLGLGCSWVFQQDNDTKLASKSGKAMAKFG